MTKLKSIRKVTTPGPALMSSAKQNAAARAARGAAAKETIRAGLSTAVFGTPAPLPAEAIDAALTRQSMVLYQAMGIVELASRVLQGYMQPISGAREGHDVEIAWAALDGAHALLNGVADRLQTPETLLAKEVSRGEY
jgi:hypothetical protein